MAQNRYFQIEVALRDMRDVVASVLDANPTLPQHVRRPLESQVEAARLAINLPEDEAR